ncbi:hypothetical protein [Effusibacillus dendaii]|uniref:Uncharacterized protein n=1 Tax=Effusibacillus dendaii TaxID=2743772 RepID=A0A7I8D949_9BACL|nr:hypothetical protein [Effusibacillus dendaii]BCJ86527.1 hypothetical protein skT53_15120 [Effusibacillus dendaii]
MEGNQCCKCDNRVDEHHVMCDACFTELREQAFHRLLQLKEHPEIPVSIKELRTRLALDFEQVEKDPDAERFRTSAAKFFLANDYPGHYRFKG